MYFFLYSWRSDGTMARWSIEHFTYILYTAPYQCRYFYLIFGVYVFAKYSIFLMDIMLILATTTASASASASTVTSNIFLLRSFSSFLFSTVIHTFSIFAVFLRFGFGTCFSLWPWLWLRLRIRLRYRFSPKKIFQPPWKTNCVYMCSLWAPKWFFFRFFVYIVSGLPNTVASIKTLSDDVLAVYLHFYRHFFFALLLLGKK